MTISAMTSEGDPVSPALFSEMGLSDTEIHARLRKLTAEGLFCPHCFRALGKLYPVRYRKGTENRRSHFFHPKNEESRSECKNYSSESEKHLSAKHAIAISLSNISIDVQVEHRIYHEDGSFRKPDVLATFVLDGRVEAHEVQISHIDSVTLEQRTNALLGHGCSKVHWYLYGANFNEENRAWGYANGVSIYHLWFQNQEDCKPKFAPDQYKPIKEIVNPKGLERDYCSLRKNKQPVVPSNTVSSFREVPPSKKRSQSKRKAISFAVEESNPVEVAILYKKDGKEYWVRGYQVCDPGNCSTITRRNGCLLVKRLHGLSKPINMDENNVSELLDDVKYYTFAEVFGTSTQCPTV